MRDQPSTGEFRADLDGLRGIAILLVACFHIWFGRVSGGVDVFLTLSGYFFVGSLLRHVIASRPPTVPMRAAVNPVPRLIRLARRLLPALVAVLTAISVLTVLVLPQTRWLAAAQEVVASLFYYQNWHLARNSLDYTAADASGSPLQHLWSMSVQGQFFVAMLILGLAFAGAIKIGSRRWPRLAEPAMIRGIAGAGLGIVALISLTWAQSQVAVDQGWNYYDTLARVWEPLAGGLVAIWMPAARASAALRNLVLAAGVALIVGCGWWLDGAATYPGVQALVPTLATVGIIWAGGGGQRPALSRMLAHPWIVWLGATAYSLYLWHWPQLIFYLAWRQKESVGVAEGFALLVASIGMAWLTKRFVEDPLRAGGARPRVSLPDAGFGPARSPRGGRLDRDPAAAIPAAALLRSAAPAGSTLLRTRHRAPRRAAPTFSPRLLRYSTALTALLVVCAVAMPVGAWAWQTRVAAISTAPEQLDPSQYPGARAMFEGLPVPDVPPRPDLLEASRDLPVTTRNGDISTFEDDEVRVGTYGDPDGDRTIVLAGGSHSEFWITALDAIGRAAGVRITTYLKMGCPLATEPAPYVFGIYYPQCGTWVDEVMRRIVDDRPDAVFTTSTRPRAAGLVGDWMPPTYVDVFRRLDAAGIPTLAVRDTPWPSTFRGRGVLDCLAGKSPQECTTPRSWILSPGDPVARTAAQIPHLHPLEFTDALCDDQVCYPVVGNIVAYHDLHHLTSTFVYSLIPELRRQIERALPGLVS